VNSGGLTDGAAFTEEGPRDGRIGAAQEPPFILQIGVRGVGEAGEDGVKAAVDGASRAGEVRREALDGFIVCKVAVEEFLVGNGEERRSSVEDPATFIVDRYGDAGWFGSGLREWG
jgi:hypothetical protein